jgi:hypothetical protein
MIKKGKGGFKVKHSVLSVAHLYLEIMDPQLSENEVAHNAKC